MQTNRHSILGTLAAVTLTVSAAGTAAWAVGGPVLIGTDAADQRGSLRDNDCRGCGPDNAGEFCTNTCFTDTGCEDPTRTTFAGSPKTGEGGGSCRQFDGDQTACERAWHRTEDDIPTPCFFCQNTNGQCQEIGECRGCGSSNLGSDTGCEQTCLTCRDAGRSTFAGGPNTGQGGGACRQFDGNQSDCELAWHMTDDALPSSCFFCQGTEGACDAPGECRGCGESNQRDEACLNTCLPCEDASRTIFGGGQGRGLVDGARGGPPPSGPPGACRQFDGDPTSCNQAWHLTGDGLPATCFVDDRGNIDGYAYLEKAFDGMGPKVRNGNTLAVCLGCNGGRALDAFEAGFDRSILPGLGWTRAVVTELADLEGFFLGTNSTTLDDTGILYIPSAGESGPRGLGGGPEESGGITGPSECRGCGPKNEGGEGCTNTCDAGPPPTCADAGRTIAAGGAGTRACQQFGDQSTCEQAWHVNKWGVASVCVWNGQVCRGCGRGNNDCTNTCVPPPACSDGTRIIDTGGPGFDNGRGCRQFDGDQTLCEQAWHTIGSFVGVSCHWEGFSCAPCKPGRELDGTCTNTCGAALPTPICADGSRPNALGGPRENACHEFDFDEAGCNAAWHVGKNGRAASCFTDENQIAILNAHAAQIGTFVNEGGGFFAHSLIDLPGGYDWLTTLLPGVVIGNDNSCQGAPVRLTTHGTSAFPPLADGGASGIDQNNGRFAGDLGGLADLGSTRCVAPIFQCADPTRPRFAAPRRACRAFDGNQSACEEAWHLSNRNVPTPCFFCQGSEGNCDAAGECRGCGNNNLEDGACTNTCIDPEGGLCDDDTRVRFGGNDNACNDFDGDASACTEAWHLGLSGAASCFVCSDDEGRCDEAGDCRGCGFANEIAHGVCENTCGEPPVCQDRKRKVLAPEGTENRNCRTFDGNRRACEQAWHFAREGVPASCFFCQGFEGQCGKAGECRGCGPANERVGACASTCGLAPRGTEGAVLIGGDRVALGLPETLDHFEGYSLKDAPKLAKDCHVLLDDSTSVGWDGPIEYTLTKMTELLAPADKTEKQVPPDLLPNRIPTLDALFDEDVHLTAYQLKRKKGVEPKKHAKQTGVLIQNQFGTLRFDTDKELSLLVPAAKDFEATPPTPGPALVDHYKCYKIKVAKNAPGSQQDGRGKFAKRQVIVVDQFENGRAFACQPGSPTSVGRSCKDDKTCGGAKGAFDFCGQGDGHPEFANARVYDLKKPTAFCVPIEKAAGTASSCAVAPSGALAQPALALACYQKKLASKDGRTGKEKIDPKQAKHVARPLFVTSQLGEDSFSTKKEQELCVPSVVIVGTASHT
jgi:hypothetical protein